MGNVDYGTWGKSGWLGTSEYYSFWGRVFAVDLKPFFQDKTILDIGAGNGQVWQEALNVGLAINELHLIDPALDIALDLSQRRNVISHRKSLDELQYTHADIALFKQSLHHVYNLMGQKMFDTLQVSQFINFSMPAEPEWPMSPELQKRYLPSCLNIVSLSMPVLEGIALTTTSPCPIVLPSSRLFLPFSGHPGDVGPWRCQRVKEQFKPTVSQSAS